MDPLSENARLAAFQAHLAGKMTEAESACRRWLADEPANVEARLLLGTVLHQAGRYREAAAELQRATDLQPASLGAWSRLGSAWRAAREPQRAADAFARCVELDPACAPARYQLANACAALGQGERAVALYRETLALDPRDFKAWTNLGNALRGLGRLDESLAAYDRALALDPGCALAHWNRALTLLTAGRWPEGFVEYEWRHRVFPSRNLSRPAWDGTPLPGKTLLLLSEQGCGDMIQFARYVPLARQRVGKVILECYPPLAGLFAELADAVSLHGAIPPPFDCHLPLMSLPRLFGTTVERLPTAAPYLAAPPLEPLPPIPPGHRRVGLTWSGNAQNEDNERRSLHLAELQPLLEIPGVTFFSLQKPVPEWDEPTLRSRPNLIDLEPRLASFKETAGFLGQMDLVVTVDTAVAHLAGALGKPTWTLLHAAADWRWLRHRTDSPWYPSMRLFRQDHSTQWQPVVAAVAAELRRWLGQP